mmetsp:Transcript_5528/g.19231  ORF Transcript_5528/g.19231 Transcript_5528/m.19231 type:complete len:329 (+) Transcript_5528:112-1098(+)
MADILLYNQGSSPFATLCRLVLAEKNLTFRKRDVSYYNWNQEHLEPFYAHVNPKMQIPAMTVTSESGDKTTLTDSRDILEYLENDLGSGRSLVDPKKKRETWAFVDSFYALKFMPLFMHNFRENQPAVLMMVKDGQEKTWAKLELLSKQYPELEQTYLDKREAMKKYTADFIDSADQVPENRKRAEDLLDEAEALLAGQPEGNQNRWLFGEYSVADCCMTQLVAMLRLLDIMSFDGRPNLKQFWEAAQKRPSYEAAGVTDELPMKMRVMMFIGSMVWKAKAAVVPKWKEAMAEADRQVKEAKKAVSEQMKDAKKAVSENLDRAIGAKK